jgi:hypothetical protein
MIAAYDLQFATPAAAPEAPPQSEEPPKEPGSGAKPPEVLKTPEELAAEEAAKAAEPPKDPKESETPPATLADLVDSGDFFAGLGSETVPENLSAALVAAGLKAEQVPAINERLKTLLAAEAKLQTMELHGAAGGKEQFDQLIAWGKANFTPEQAAYYDRELNGPNAKDVIAMLQVKATRGQDPSLVNVNGGGGAPVQGYRSQAEMQRDMRDPRYNTDPAFRADVRQKLRFATY